MIKLISAFRLPTRAASLSWPHSDVPAECSPRSFPMAGDAPRAKANSARGDNSKIFPDKHTIRRAGEKRNGSGSV